MEKDIRTERVTGRVTYKNKLMLKELKKEENLTIGDIIEIYLLSRSANYKQTLIEELRLLDSKIEVLSQIIKEQERLLKKYQTDQENYIKQKHDVKSKLAQQDYKQEVSERLKQAVEAYIITLNQHTDVYGSVKPYFNQEQVGRRLCTVHNVDYSTFLKAVDVVKDKGGFDELGDSDLDDLIV